MNRKNKNYHDELKLNSDLMEILLLLLRRNSTTVAEHRRIQIIMHYHESNDSFKDVAKQVNLNSETVSLWYNRGQIISNEWERMLKNTLQETGHAGNRLRRERLLKELVADKPRSGAPVTYTIKQYTDIVRIALEKPSKYNRPITHWTARELKDEVDKQQIAANISQRQIQRFLAQADLKPHKSTYWLNPKIDNIEEYEQQVKELCDIYHNAEKLNADGVQIISTDEKTGMQALERIHPDKPMIPGKEELIEAEYRRHGTLCLMPSFNVGTGKIIEYYIGETRTEIDFADHIKKTVAAKPKAPWIFICDNLNTHISETLVKTVARLIGYKEELGVKGKRGILKNIKSRQKFLRNKEHKIYFMYTPKHCSWLNQVEIWFSILARKVLKRGNFVSTDDLRRKVEDFISYFNATMGKPFKWTYKGKPLTI